MTNTGDETPSGGDNPHGPDSGSSPDYEVGYRKPPKSGQFKPGQSGNPRGRKKREPTIIDRLKKELNRKVPISEHGRKRSVPKFDLMLMSVTNSAAKGDLKALGMIIALLSSQAAETTPELNTDVMSPEDIALLESYLRGMDMGEPLAGPDDGTDPSSEDNGEQKI